MKHFKQLLFLSILCSLVLFTNCGDSDVVVVDTPTNNTDDDKTDDGTTDPVNYTLTLTASEGGTVSPESGSFGENEAVELLATPDSTYVFVNWTGSSTDTDNPFSVTMDSDKSYTANFVKKQYPLTIIIEGEGAVSEEIVTNGRVEDYDVGTLVQLTATPSQGWKFNGWKELEVETNPLEVTITEAITLTAKFYVPIDSVSLTPSALQMVLGGIDTLKASIYPTNASDTINWKSSDESIVTVNQDGIVTAIAKGEAVITVMTAKDSITNTAKVVISTDGDKDGIIDENDTCADTPEGATVDANGCADSQKDTDSDGVKDDKDTCADTPEGATVDTNGCADSQKDTDSDGVKDDKDTCSDTPEGATVDANGCADSQKDTDSDGVKDDKDTCSDTPEGATVDANGCADSQKDTDGDGVTDDLDTCAGTASGATVDANGCAYAFRTDTYSSFLKLAIPGSTFTGLITDGFDDVHADIVGSGTNIQYALTGSATEVNLDTDVKWGADGYGTSVFTQDAGQWGTTTEAQLNWQSSNFVIEGYVYMDETFARPPFWKVPVRHDKYFVSADFGNPNPVVAGSMRMRLTLDTSVQGQTQYVSSNVSYNLNQWYHIAWVRTGNQLRYYFDGNNVYATSFSGGSIDTDGTLYRIMRGESITNDGAAGSWQDFRVYIGTDKGYTTETITPPLSMVEKL
jgi:uncharacterized repeat protein (TIGR02543 family)